MERSSSWWPSWTPKWGALRFERRSGVRCHTRDRTKQTGEQVHTQEYGQRFPPPRNSSHTEKAPPPFHTHAHTPLALSGGRSWMHRQCTQHSSTPGCGRRRTAPSGKVHTCACMHPPARRNRALPGYRALSSRSCSRLLSASLPAPPPEPRPREPRDVPGVRGGRSAGGRRPGFSARSCTATTRVRHARAHLPYTCHLQR